LAYNSRVLNTLIRSRVLLLGTLLATTLPGPALARDTVAGLCPDGSAFVVARRQDAPCRDPKFVDDASDLPPLRPQYLPRSHAWQLNRAARDENNPYNLLDRIDRNRMARGERPITSEPQTASAPIPATSTQTRGGDGATTTALAPTSLAAPSARIVSEKPRETGPSFVMTEDELRDLARLIVLRQQIAPAELTVEDVRGRPQLHLRYAYSPSFEQRAIEALGLDAAKQRVLIFSVRSEADVEFFPSFTAIQDGVSFRPEPSREIGYVVGSAGPMAAGLVGIGYIVLPARVDAARPIDLYWNDRKLGATLSPAP
jgi:hypothetical protein